MLRLRVQISEWIAEVEVKVINNEKIKGLRGEGVLINHLGHNHNSLRMLAGGL